MTDLRKAAEMALEALKNGIRVRAGEGGTKYQPDLEDAAIAALEVALAQPEQEHKPWCDYLNIMLTSLPPQKAKCNCKNAQPEQEPCKCIDEFWCATFDRCKRNE